MKTDKVYPVTKNDKIGAAAEAGAEKEKDTTHNNALSAILRSSVFRF